MKDPWLNFQYKIEFSSGSGGNSGECSVLSINANAVKHGTSSYLVNPVHGDPVKRYVYGGTYTEPISISILLGEGARPWPNDNDGQLWLRWDLINCYPVSWNIGALAVEESASPMKIDMTLQFESMVVLDGDNELSEIMG